MQGKWSLLGNGTDLDRLELYVDARDLQKEEMTDIEYQAKLTERGNEKLAENVEVQSFDSKINLNSNLTYKVDFDLGDKVTCEQSVGVGVTIDTRITEIEEVYENTGKQVNVIFGNRMPELVDKIKEVIQ